MMDLLHGICNALIDSGFQFSLVENKRGRKFTIHVIGVMSNEQVIALHSIALEDVQVKWVHGAGATLSITWINPEEE